MNGVWDTDPPLLITLNQHTCTVTRMTDAQTFLANASFLVHFSSSQSVFPFHVCILQPEVQQSFPLNFKFCRVDLLLLRRDMPGRIQK